MAVAALVLGIIGIVFAFIPSFAVTQFVGIGLGVVALILGVLARRKAREEGQPSGTATAGIVLGSIAAALSILIYGSCMYCYKRVGDEFEKGLKTGTTELRGEFQKAFKEAMEKAQKEHQKSLERAAEPEPRPAPAGGGE